MEKQYAIGVDFGTNSVRALVVDVADGAEIASSAYDYPSGEAGILLDPRDPHVARQNPADYIAGFTHSVREAVRLAGEQTGGRSGDPSGFVPDRIAGIGIDSTGSTPLPVDRHGTPLALHDQFKNNLAAHAWLWKDHSAHAEASEISDKARHHSDHYLSKCGNAYSSEWFWSKILHCKRAAPAVFDAAWSWVELADFIPGYVTGNTDPATMARSICAAGHKAMYHENWGGLPSEDFLRSLDPALVKLRRRYADQAVCSDQKAGELTAAVAEEVGLPAGVPVAVGAFDAHTGGVGAGIQPGTLVKIIGTSTCDMMVVPRDQNLADIPGLCGIVPGSILPGTYGLEAGQSAVGDIFNWFVNQLCPAKYGSADDAHVRLTEEASQLKPGKTGLLALDWNNGNRTILADPLLSGLVLGQTLHTTAPEIYRALVEATAFGALTIINRFEEYGVKVEQVVNCGGISEKNAMVMQIYADVCNRPMKISRSAQTCALGAAIFGAVVGEAYPNVRAAQVKMTGIKPTVFEPQPENVAVYARLYQLYKSLHDAFGMEDHGGGEGGDGLHHVMKDLIVIRDRVKKG